MAYHWSFVHSPNRDRHGPLDSCPLHRFFVRSGLADSKGARLHAELHDGGGPEVIEALTNWFEHALNEGVGSALVGAASTPRSHSR